MDDSKQRLFFALALDEPVNRATKAKITTLKNSLGDYGKPVADENLHITLAFLGDVDLCRVDGLVAGASKLELPAITLDTGELGVFRKSRILWLGFRRIPPSLVQLAGKLSGLAETLAITGPVAAKGKVAQYVPHITLCRRADNEDLPRVSLPAMPLQIARFGLYVSEPHRQGVRYRCLHSFPLGPQART